MKLEPGRTSLSGRPEFLQPPPPAPIAIKPLGPRHCSSCNCIDVTQIVQGEYGTDGAQKIEHKVTIELRYLKAREDCTGYLQSKGWRYRFHQGRHAMERFICRSCLAEHGFMEKEFRQKKARELRHGSQPDAYYMAICGGE